MRSWSCLSVAGASGAEPIETATGADRSADSKRGLAVTSSAIAGTMKIIIGLSCSTTSNQRSTSNFGMYTPREAHLHRVVDEAHAREREQRRAVQPSGAGPVRRAVRDHRDVAMADEHALRQAGRARRVHDVGHVVGVERDLHLARVEGRDLVVPPERAVGRSVGVQDGLQRRHLRGDRARGVEQVATREDRADFGVAEDRDELRHREARVRGHHDRAGLVHRGVRDDPAQAVLVRQIDRDAVTLGDAALRRATARPGSNAPPTART